MGPIYLLLEQCGLNSSSTLVSDCYVLHFDKISPLQQTIRVQVGEEVCCGDKPNLRD